MNRDCVINPAIIQWVCKGEDGGDHPASRGLIEPNVILTFLPLFLPLPSFYFSLFFLTLPACIPPACPSKQHRYHIPPLSTAHSSFIPVRQLRACLPCPQHKQDKIALIYNKDKINIRHLIGEFLLIFIWKSRYCTTSKRFDNKLYQMIKSCLCHFPQVDIK